MQMGILRKTVQREVLDSLDGTIFTKDDFNVTFGDSSANQYIIFIKFIHGEAYDYGIYRGLLGFNYVFYVDRRPGDTEEKQTYQYATLAEALAGINSWCIEIRNELKASTPIYKEIDNLKEIIFKHIAGEEKEGEFSVEEIQNLKEKFSQLEKRIEELEREKIISTTQAKEIKDGVSRVTEDLEYYPKETWLKTAANKLVNMVIAVGKSKEGREVLKGGAKKLLGIE